MSKLAGIILAAGKGTRMKSDLPKCLHRICGIPMADHVGRAMKNAGVGRPIVVIGHHGDLLSNELGDSYDYAWQREQLGTGHAAMQGATVVPADATSVFIVVGDAPLVQPETLKRIAERREESGSMCCMAIAVLDNPFGYGRIIRDENGNPTRIVEEKDASVEQKKIREVCVSVYCFNREALVKLLPTLNTNNAQGEYYLTDMISAIHESGGRTETIVVDDPQELMGVNDRWAMAEAGRILRQRILKKHAFAGVTIVDPNSTYIDAEVEIGVDTIVEPMSTIKGATKVGSSCLIGSGSNITNSRIGDECIVLSSFLNDAIMEDDTRCGPYANLRPGARIETGAKIGNFVEIKNSEVGRNVSISHLTYIGDAYVGANTNIGAGTITCNYDGFDKHRTIIGEGSFIGSNSTLIAPVSIGNDVLVAAGSVVTEDVPGGALSIARSKQEIKEGWVEKWRQRRQKQ